MENTKQFSYLHLLAIITLIVMSMLSTIYSPNTNFPRAYKNVDGTVNLRMIQVRFDMAMH